MMAQLTHKITGQTMFFARRLKKFQKILTNTRGATAVEYGLVVALICLAAITGMGKLGENASNMYSNIRSQYTNAVG
jgi:pilus assembly protein Flp/PilA